MVFIPIPNAQDSLCNKWVHYKVCRTLWGRGMRQYGYEYHSSLGFAHGHAVLGSRVNLYEEFTKLAETTLAQIIPQISLK